MLTDPLSASAASDEPSVTRWSELDRQTLARLLPEALVVLPIGATEQHGHHLATGTDALLIDRLVARAVQQCRARVVVAPTLAFGASDHHLQFGGTLSLSVETLTAVLLDIARSVAACGGRRLVIANGHGGNVGACFNAAAAATVRFGLAVAHLNYWDMLSRDNVTGIPGHAGAFETSLVLATRPDLATTPQARADADGQPIDGAGAVIHSTEWWHGIDGFTDDPRRASVEQGELWLAAVASALTDCLDRLAMNLR